MQNPAFLSWPGIACEKTCEEEGQPVMKGAHNCREREGCSMIFLTDYILKHNAKDIL